MNYQEVEAGSYTCDEDPGVLDTREKRISITPEEGKLLGFLAAGKRVLEIGTGLGVSTDFLACHARKVVTVDTDPWVWANVWPGLHKKAQCLPNRHDAEGFFDMVFVDGSHTTPDTLADIEYAHSKCHRGVIAVHDAKLPSVAVALGPSWHLIPTFWGVAVKYVGWGSE